MLPAVDERAEIEETVGEALGAMGIRGTIAVAGKNIELASGDGAPISIDIELVIRQWPLLPEEMRRRKAADVAHRLRDALRAMQLAVPAAQRQEPTGVPPRVWAYVAGGLGLLALVGVVRMVVPRLSTEKPVVGVPSEGDGARRDRLARACEAMRDRLYQGASFGPLSTEGWVVELWLASSKGGTLKSHQALAALVDKGKLVASADETIAAVSDGSAEIVDGFSDEQAPRSPGWSGVTLRLREGYARTFFEAENRQRFVSLGDRLADAVGADAGALYARCAHLRTHDIGAWFRGADAPGAVAAMVYQIGLFSDGGAVDRGAIATLRGAGGELDGLRRAAGEVEGISGLVTAQGATLSTAHGVSFVFPLPAPTRAFAATKAVARKMKVGAGAD
jgi:serine/threonine-protein kinase